jgi:cobyrinic acid a,c-diamide synthase
MTKGFVVAGTASGSGKTTITLAILAALSARGYRVAPFKVGPDFIDPGHHAKVTGIPSHNLDGWMLTRNYNQSLYAHCSQGADFAIVEGVMGLFDGYNGRTEDGSTAQVAKWLGLPVVLVVDARSMARSAAALVQGFERFDPDVRFAGVLFNRTGSHRHLTYLRDALKGHVAMPCLGGIPRDQAVAIPERHLGLHTADDHPLTEDDKARLAALVEDHAVIDRLLDGAAPSETSPAPSSAANRNDAKAVRIGVARDSAFCFYYPDNLDLLKAQGADIVYFSPMSGGQLPEGLSGLYFGGGYPELHADRLSENKGMRDAVKRCSEAGMPIYAECGGFMYLCDQLIEANGSAHAMTACFPLTTRMLTRRKSLGYREVRLLKDSPLGPAGTTGRGHEFHYSEVVVDDGAIEKLYATTPRSGKAASPTGYRVFNTLGSYIHLHFGSNPAMAKHFVSRCEAYLKNERIYHG